MAQLSVKNPRASYWRSEKIAQADHIVTRRALERDATAMQPHTPLPTRQRMAAKTYWTHPHPWSVAGSA